MKNTTIKTPSLPKQLKKAAPQATRRRTRTVTLPPPNETEIIYNY